MTQRSVRNAFSSALATAAWQSPIRLLAIGLLASCWVSAEARAASADHFIPVDTSRLMGSPDPLPLETEPAFPNLQFDRPVEFTFANDGTNRVFVVEQNGTIRVFENQRDVKESKLFLDIHEVVSRVHNEEGLLGLAFHPKYRENGLFYVYYSDDVHPRATVVAQFRVSAGDSDKADRSSEKELLRIAQPYGNHKGGSMKFGPDGFLYIGLGDGGSGGDPHGNAQNLGTLLGKMLRIDVDHKDPGLEYAIPKDNPFVGTPGARGEIWAYGIRNIWRLAFDRQTGDLWVGEVGQDAWEEVDVIVRGGNYGWNIREGTHPFKPNAKQTGGPLIEPVIDYPHSVGRCVIGGVVYRGKQLPDYDGAYFYADFTSGNIWALWYDGHKLIENRKVAKTDLMIAAFGEDCDGEMYLACFDGRIYRLRDRKANLAALREAFPHRLSETGLFVPGKGNTPVAGMIPYSVQVPLWSDVAVKERFIALPKARTVGFTGEDQWRFPVGSVLVKTFSMNLDRQQQREPKLLETRFLVHSPNGWVGYTYVWNDEETDAVLIRDAETKTLRVKTAAGTVDQQWYFPSRDDCMSCHSQSRSFVLGLNARQLNGPITDSSGNPLPGDDENQLVRLDRLNVFRRPIGDPHEYAAYPAWGSASGPTDAKAPIETLARAYLDVNCSMCHAKMGLQGARPDFHYFTPLAEAAMINREPGQGGIGPRGTKIVVPGKPELSEIVARTSRRGPGQMPPLATSMVDEKGLAIVRQWIAEMPATTKALPQKR